MEYKLGTIRQANIEAHDDIETDILAEQDGLFTFTLRINGGNIVDYNVVKYVNVRNYLTDEVINRQLSISQYYRTGGGKDTLWNDNSKRNA